MTTIKRLLAAGKRLLTAGQARPAIHKDTRYSGQPSQFSSLSSRHG